MRKFFTLKLATLGFAAIFAFGAVAQTPPKGDLPADAKSTGEVAKPQQQNAKLFKDLTTKLLALAVKLDASDRPGDKDRAKTIRAALEVAEKAGVDNQFRTLVGGMSGGTRQVQDLEKLIGQDEELSKSLLEMLNILMTDDETARIKAEIAMLEKFVKEAEELKRRQELLRTKTDSKKGDTKEISKNQNDLAGQTKDLANRMAGKKGDGKSAPKAEPKSEPKPTDAKAGENASEPKGPGEAKPSESPDKPAGQGKGSAKPSEGKAGQGKGKPSDPKDAPSQPPSNKGSGQPSGQPQDSPPPPQNQTPGRKSVEEAVPPQKGAEEDVEKDKREDASKKMDKAIEKLTNAIEEMKKRLKQLREEELMKLLANLESRCNRMLAMQIEVYENTKQIHAAVVKNDNQKTNADIQKSQQQSDKEKEIVAEAEKTLKLLETEGSAVAFANVLQEVMGDMQAVQARLEKAVVDTDTQTIEENIIAMLKDMVAALKKQQQEMQNKPPSPPGQPGKPNQQLINLLAELKLIRALQNQVNLRTTMYGKKSNTEQTDDPLIQNELKQLAQRQVKLQDMIQKIATQANQ